MTHKYLWAETLTRTLIPRFGTEVMLEVPETTIAGQDKPETYTRYQIPALLVEDLKGRGSRYTRADRSRAFLPTSTHAPPKPGDVLTFPSGKKYMIEMVSYLKPAGVNLAYEVHLSDG